MCWPGLTQRANPSTSLTRCEFALLFGWREASLEGKKQLSLFSFHRGKNTCGSGRFSGKRVRNIVGRSEGRTGRALFTVGGGGGRIFSTQITSGEFGESSVEGVWESILRVSTYGVGITPVRTCHCFACTQNIPLLRLCWSSAASSYPVYNFSLDFGLIFPRSYLKKNIAQEDNRKVHRARCTRMFNASLLIRVENWTQSKCSKCSLIGYQLNYETTIWRMLCGHLKR